MQAVADYVAHEDVLNASGLPEAATEFTEERRKMQGGVEQKA